MEFVSNPYSLILFASGFIAFILSLFLLIKVKGIGIVGVATMMAATIWAIGSGMELGSTTLDQKLMWIKVLNIGVAFIPTLWIVFLIKFVGLDKWLTPINVVLLFIEPVLTLIVVWTNDLHHLQMTIVNVIQREEIFLLVIDKGVWYYIHLIYFYFMMVAGVFLLLKKRRKDDEIYNKQYKTILLGSIFPWLFNLIYLFGFRPLGGVDITPISFIITSIIIAVGLLRYRLFDIIPIARERIFEAMREGVLVIDNYHRVVDVNPSMRNLLMPYNTNIIGLKFRDLISIMKKSNMEITDASVEGAEVCVNEGNHQKHYAVTITPLLDDKKGDNGKIFVIKDITEQKLNEEKLNSLNELKDKLFSVIAHDLRSPLINLLEILNLASDGNISESELRMFLPQLKKDVGHTTNLVENLLQWSKSQLKGEITKPVKLDLQKMTGSIIQTFSDKASEKGIRLENNLSESFYAYADKDMIQAVYRNLISNAIKFCSKGDMIQVSCEVNKGETTLCITDTGVGISESDISKLFKPGSFSMKGTLNEQGTGLGLLLVKDFVEKNNGRIWVDSILGIGTTFCFSLPSEQPSVAN
ncbi:MAG TPA: histidine kinase N-terminal 7TM domain-containing protein [Sphingobacteriaceae bacterium]|nr:histidine kinase N-terminal 7TM domain-containing protein [Sphingobacteriaceae bacterium]